MVNKKYDFSILENLTRLDWIIFFAVLVITLFAVYIGNYVTRHKNNSFNLIEHLVMGRKLTLPLFVGTLVATWYGGIFGVTQIAFEKGIYNFITQGFFWYVAYLIFAFFMVGKISQHEALTLPDLIGKMFGPKSRKVAAIFNFFNVVPIAYIISLGLFIKTFTGWSLEASMVSGLAVVLSYSLWGGLRSVVISDMVQFFVMVTSVFLVILFSYSQFGGLSFLKEQLSPKYFTITSDENYWQLFAWGFIALSTLVDPNFYQRCFAAKKPQVAKKGILISTLVWVIFDLCTTFGAMYAKAVIPHASSGEAYLIYSINLLPGGLKGFFLAGILATILSTLDSYLFLAGSTLTYDLSPRKFSKKSGYHILGILFVGFLGILMASIFEGDIKLVWKTLGSYSAGCLLFPVVYGYLSHRKISDLSFVATCLVSAFTMTLWRLFPQEVLGTQIDSLYIGVLTSFIMLLSTSWPSKAS